MLKETTVKPLLKQSTSPEEFKNFTPISNLRFISKIIEKCMATQLSKYLDANCLGEVFQSAYKGFHSTETALIRVLNKTAIAIDNQESVILLLLDLSGSFDTLSRLQNALASTVPCYNRGAHAHSCITGNQGKMAGN